MKTGKEDVAMGKGEEVCQGKNICKREKYHLPLKGQE